MTAEDEQCQIISKYFKQLFSSDDTSEIVHPAPMDPPFTQVGIKRIAKKLKNNKATGRDGANAELIKYGTDQLYSKIANLLNKTSETGNYPEEIRRGILTPSAKPKRKEEQVNVRPIILLSVLRKLIAIDLIDRWWDRLKLNIPPSQAAYQGGRSTTEQVFSLKILVEKAITSERYDIFILMLDMSKAFDTVNRPKLINILRTILTPTELYMMHLLIDDVILNAKAGDTFGEDILIMIGLCQGDCLSAILFIVYLAYVLKPLPQMAERIDHTETLWSALDWLVHNDVHNIEIDPKYADDITYIRSLQTKINQAERLIPPMLEEEGLFVNKSKTEKYHASLTSSTEWKKCKCLGSLLGTEEDIKRRKGLTISSYNSYEDIFCSRRISEKVRLRAFKQYVESIFLYNSELWTLTKTLQNQIDSFQRRLLRKVIHVRWPRINTNERLYECTPWSKIIRRRRLNWFGHLLRLPEGTPAQQALSNFIKPTTRPRGRPKTTLLDTILNDIKLTNIPYTNNLAIDIATLKALCSDRQAWYAAVAALY